MHLKYGGVHTSVTLCPLCHAGYKRKERFSIAQELGDQRAPTTIHEAAEKGLSKDIARCWHLRLSLHFKINHLLT